MIINEFENYTIDKTGIIKNIKGITIKPRLHSKTGYLQVTLWSNGKAKTFSIHRLVAMHFITNNGKPQVNHIDGNKLNNNVDNLEWVTDSENKIHCYATGLKSKNILSKPIYQCKKHTNIRIKKFNSANQCSRELGINQGNISNCCRNKCKSVGGFTFIYA